MSNLICNSTELDQRFSLPITEVFSCPICCVSSDDLFEQECRAIATRLGYDDDKCTLNCTFEGYYISDKMMIPQCVSGETVLARGNRSVGNMAIKQTYNLSILMFFVIMLGLFFRK